MQFSLVTRSNFQAQNRDFRSRFHCNFQVRVEMHATRCTRETSISHKKYIEDKKLLTQKNRASEAH